MFQQARMVNEAKRHLLLRLDGCWGFAPWQQVVAAQLPSPAISSSCKCTGTSVTESPCVRHLSVTSWYTACAMCLHADFLYTGVCNSSYVTCHALGSLCPCCSSMCLHSKQATEEAPQLC